MAENFDEFYDDFYDGQFKYYDRKAERNKRYHRITKCFEIFLAASLPVSVSLFPVTSSPFWKNAIILAAVALLIVESLESYLNYDKKWLEYRSTAEELRKEEQRFKTRTGDYKEAKDAEELFVDRVLELTSQETRDWEKVTQKAQEV